MKDIILDFLGKSIKEIEEIAQKVFEGQEDISKLTEGIKEKTDEMGRKIFVELIEGFDEAIRKDTKRKKTWEIVRKDIKTLITKLGEIKYQRTYFKSKLGKGYKYLADGIVGIEVHQRKDAGIEADLIDLAAEISYRKSGEKAGDIELSGQTVMNSIRKVEEIEEVRIADKKKEVETLYIEADEDHVALQEGKVAMPKLVYIHEGRKMQGKRAGLKNVYYYADAKKKPEDIWNEVREYIENNYEIKSIRRIYVSGDGADWIKKGAEYFENARFVLDRYHMNKYVLGATGHDKQYRSKLWEALNITDKGRVKEILDDLEKTAVRATDIKQVKDAKKYFLNNWEGIEIQALEEAEVIGCSAEGHISHILSARLSSRPSGWSRHGLDQMAKLRAFKANGGNVYDLVLRQKKEEKIYELGKSAARQMRKVFKEKVRETFNNIAVINYGKVTPIYRALKSLQYT